MKKIKLLSIIMSAIILSFTLVGCKDSSKEETKKETIKVGLSPDYPPFEFMDTDKNIMGYDIMIAEEIAKDMDKKLEIVPMDFNSLITALKGKKIDMILSGMNPTAKRKKSVDFSRLYHISKHYAVINTKNKDVIKTEKDIDGKKIGVQMGTTQEKIARDKFEKSEIIAYKSISDVMLLLKSGKIDVAITEDAVAEAYVLSNSKELMLPGISFQNEGEGVAVAVRKGEDDLLKSINSTLDRLEKEGKLDKFFKESIKLSKNQIK